MVERQATRLPKDTPSYHVEVDEFCIFDRDLTDDELAALAGRKALPKK